MRFHIDYMANKLYYCFCSGTHPANTRQKLIEQETQRTKKRSQKNSGICIILFSEKCPLRPSIAPFRSKPYKKTPNVRLNTKNYSLKLKLSENIQKI